MHVKWEVKSSCTWGRRLNICFISSSKFCSSMRSASSITRHYKITEIHKVSWTGDQSVMVYWHSWPWIMFSISAFPYGEITWHTRPSQQANIWAAQPSTPNLLGFAPGLGLIKGKMFWDHPIQTVCLKHIFPSENIILNFRDGRESGTNNFKLPKQFSADFLKKIVTPDKLNP